MPIVVRPDAERDAEEGQAWWRAHRPSAPAALADDLAGAFARLAHDATIVPVFARVGGLLVRRVQLPRTHRHVYFVVDDEAVVILAIWGAVRGVLPRLRARAR